MFAEVGAVKGINVIPLCGHSVVPVCLSGIRSTSLLMLCLG